MDGFFPNPGLAWFVPSVIVSAYLISPRASYSYAVFYSIFVAIYYFLALHTDIVQIHSFHQSQGVVTEIFVLSFLYGITALAVGAIENARRRANAELSQANKELEVERFVHTSTSEVYGTAQYVPMDE